MKLLTEDSFDFKKPQDNKNDIKKKKTFFIILGSVVISAIMVFTLEYNKSEKYILEQENMHLNQDYIKTVSKKWDLLYNGEKTMVADYVKLGKAIKEQDEDSILMYYTLLKARTDVSTMAYMSNFELEVFSTHSFRIGKKIHLDPKDNDSTTKSYKLSEKLISKMKKVYLSRTYPDKIALNHDCDEQIEFCYYSKEASKIIEDYKPTMYENNHKKLQEIMK